MNLLSSLLSGFAAAANGHAEIYVRGSSSRATWYGDLEASSSNSSGANVTLDAYGSALVYVNQLVDVVVKDSGGNVVRSYGDGYSSPSVEVISPAFTGVDYVTGASAVSEPTTLQTVLDRWFTNAGSPDWKVSLDGVATTMLNAFGSLSGLVFNVKSPAYGAVGDGVANDQAAIQAALAAAVAAGGGTVFFPKGTYLVTTAIEWDNRVSIWGWSPNSVTIITNSVSNARIITFTVGSIRSAPIVISGVSFSASQSNTGTELYATVGVNLIVEKCVFGQSTSATGTLASFSGASNRITFRDCVFFLNNNNTAATWSNTSRTITSGCYFLTTAGAYVGSMLQPAGLSDIISDCVFDKSTTSGGAVVNYAIDMTFAGALQVTNCNFVSVQAFTNHLKLIAAGSVFTSNNRTNDGGVTYLLASGTLSSSSRLQMRAPSSPTTSTVITDANDLWVYATLGGVPTFTMPTGYHQGQRLKVLIRNGSGGGWTPVFTGATVIPGVTIPATTATNGCVVDFIYTDLATSGTFLWRAFYAVGA